MILTAPMWAAVAASAPKALINAQPAEAADFTLFSAARAILSFNNSGNVVVTGGVGEGFMWLLIGQASEYEIRVQGSGNTPVGDALDTWLSLGVTRSWELSGVPITIKSFSGTYEIRRASDQLVLGGNSFNLTAEAEF